jgi:putative DNA primase/helicase
VQFLTSGNAISARLMYEREMRTFTPSHLLLLLTGHHPIADASDQGFWDRLRLINFSQHMVPTPDLWQALASEASGILAWLVRGCLAWQRCGLDTPAAVLAAGEQYQLEQEELQKIKPVAHQESPKNRSNLTAPISKPSSDKLSAC